MSNSSVLKRYVMHCMSYMFLCQRTIKNIKKQSLSQLGVYASPLAHSWSPSCHNSTFTIVVVLLETNR